jgi:hypothetical protein
MDLSKLPKFSQTPPPPSADAPDPTPATAASGSAPAVELFCRCGAPIKAGTNFCSNCGASYDQATGGPGRGAPRAPEPSGGMWIEAFFSIAIGLFLLFIAPNGIKYMSAKISGNPFTPYLHPTETGVHVDFERFQNPQTGAITDFKYVDRFEHYWSDMSVTLFALALILEGIVLAVVKNRWVVLTCALLIVGATILNLWYVAASFTRTNPITGTTYGLPAISALAVIFGVVMASYQFKMFTEISRRRGRIVY